ncbi:MAG: nucleotide pyrophosphohydrolase [Candidatus Levybacteria bacterium]|nr:nucleotide pyrophosphohydrolase [Candidatus Levybacteria bacterium]
MDIKEFQDIVIKFRDARSWKQFHNPKDTSLSLVLEATEVMEHFQWKNEEEIKDYVKSNRNNIGKELADVFYWILLIAHDLNIDLAEVFKRKMTENNTKYPIKKSKSKHLKYTKL